jgi:VIT1/CCC1 family predicted Fe2+/Mn2+ transporter
MPELDAWTRRALLGAQRNEITEHHVYRRLASATADPHNREVLEKIAADELSHYGVWRKLSGADVPPSGARVLFYYLVSRLLGLTFGTKLMEAGEKGAQKAYKALAEKLPEAAQVARDEARHESELTSMIDEERLRYAGSVVLGLNDALVELTGMLAGLTLAFQNGRLIAATGLIMGVAASLSMAASEYLSTKSDYDAGDRSKTPLKASLYTGAAYVAAVCVLIAPFFALSSVYAALAATLAGVVTIIFVFTFYVSVAKELGFWRRFLEMVIVSLSIAAVSFGIGWLVRRYIGVDA